MRFYSTRDQSASYSLDEAIMRGLAADGGLIVPSILPDATLSSANASLAEIGAAVFSPFFRGSALEASLNEICNSAFSFFCPTTPYRNDLSVLELYHGPTAAFKDVGARFLAACLNRLAAIDDTAVTILAATSGDTGGAVAAAVADMPNLSAVIAFPKGRVSPMQEHQLTCWGDNILSLRIKSDFDACQQFVKRALADPALNENARLTSANSINICRLLAQTLYYFQSSLLHYERRDELANFIIPTGNLGNALSCIWAKEMGAPIGRTHIALNVNKTLYDYAQSGTFVPRASVETIANAMDVGAPSNFERLNALLGGRPLSALDITVSWHSDKDIAGAMRREYALTGKIFCPHSSTAFAALDALSAEEKNKAWIIVATADPAKFSETVEAVLGIAPAMPKSLSALLAQPVNATDCAGDYESYRAAVGGFMHASENA